MIGAWILVIMGVMAILGGAIFIGLILIGIGLYFIIPKMKYKKKISDLDVSKDELEKAKRKKDELLNKASMPRIDIQEVKSKEKYDYEEWVKNVKSNKLYKGKDFFSIDDLGLLWYENNKYYLYIVNTSKKMYEICSEYKDGIIVSNEIDLKQDTQFEVVHHNNKLKGAMLGAAIAGTAGAVVGQNVENTTERKEQDTKYYLIIDNKQFEIQLSDSVIIRQFDDENGKTIKNKEVKKNTSAIM